MKTNTFAWTLLWVLTLLQIYVGVTLANWLLSTANTDLVQVLTQ